MTTFDKREEAFERKFVVDEELQFKADARRNRLLGLWVAGRLGLSGDAATAYARHVVSADFEESGDRDAFHKGDGRPCRQGRRTGRRTYTTSLLMGPEPPAKERSRISSTVKTPAAPSRAALSP